MFLSNAYCFCFVHNPNPLYTGFDILIAEYTNICIMYLFDQHYYTTSKISTVIQFLCD